LLREDLQSADAKEIPQKDLRKREMLLLLRFNCYGEVGERLEREK
jgi:hypothetical protein